MLASSLVSIFSFLEVTEIEKKKTTQKKNTNKQTQLVKLPKRKDLHPGDFLQIIYANNEAVLSNHRMLEPFYSDQEVSFWTALQVDLTSC